MRRSVNKTDATPKSQLGRPVWEASFLKMVTCWCSATAKSGVCPARRPEFSTSILQNISHRLNPHVTNRRVVLCSEPQFTVLHDDWPIEPRGRCLQGTSCQHRSVPTRTWHIPATSSALVSAQKLQWNSSQHKLGTATPRPGHLHSYNTIEYKTRQDNISLVTTPFYKAIFIATITKQHY